MVRVSIDGGKNFCNILEAGKEDFSRVVKCMDKETYEIVRNNYEGLGSNAEFLFYYLQLAPSDLIVREPMGTVKEEILAYWNMTRKSGLEEYGVGDFRVIGGTKHKDILNVRVTIKSSRVMKVGSWNPKESLVLMFTLENGGIAYYDTYNEKLATNIKELK